MTHKPSVKDQQQYTTFYVGKDLYGIEVMRVQEVTGNPVIVPVPLAPTFVLGMINLRGQIATALGLRTLFGHSEDPKRERMSVVCKLDGNLVSLLVDSIGDVLEVDRRQFEKPPETVPHTVRKYLNGVCKLEGVLLSVIDIENLSRELSHSVSSSESGENRSENRRTA